MNNEEQINILLIENDPKDADLFQEILDEKDAHSFTVERADRLGIGLDRLAQGGIDVVMLGLFLPDSQGLDTFSKAYSQAHSVPIVVMSSLDDETVAVKAVRQGAQDYLVKGEVDNNLLLRTLRHAISRKQAAEALRESEERLRSTIASMDDLVFVIDAKGVFLECYQLTRETELYISPEQFVGKPFKDVLPPYIAEPFELALNDVAATGDSRRFDYSLDLQNEEMWFSANVSRRLDAAGEFAGVTAVVRNVTDRVRAEREIREHVANLEQKNRQIKALQQVGTLLTGALDLDGVLDEVGQHALKALNATAMQIMVVNEEKCILEGKAVAEENKLGQLTKALGLEAKKIIAPLDSEGGGPIVDVALSGKSRVISDIATIGGSRSVQMMMGALGKIFDVRRLDIIALCAKDTVVGVLSLGYAAGKEITDEHQDLVMAFASQTAIALENARLYQQAQSELVERVRAEAQIKASLEEKEALLKEIHHRVKNNLQVISSILNMQSRYMRDEQAIEQLMESRNRVYSMALVHESLYQSESLAQVNVATYVRNLVANLSQSYGVSSQAIELEIDINDIFLQINQAIPCGLIINELVSNAMKHAFQGREKGKIRIEICAPGSDQLALIVGDDGVGLPQDRWDGTTQTLGLRLVNILTKQLDAEMELDTRDGTTFKITF